ncbi:ATP-binding protein [Nitratifractor sp.]
MSLRASTLCCFLLPLLLPAETIGLSPAERDSLRAKREIVVCDFADWMPYMGHEGNRSFGIVHDYFEAFGSSLGIPMRFVRAPGTAECVEEVLAGRADVVSSIDNSPNTFRGIVTSKSYGEDFLALVTSIDTPFVSSLDRLRGAKIAVLRHYHNLQAALRRRYPHLRILPVESTEEGFRAVARGEAFGLVHIYRVAAYTIRRRYVGELKINSRIAGFRVRAHVGVRKEEPMLRDLFDRAIDALSPEERQQIIDRWMRAEEVVHIQRIPVLILGLALSVLLFFLLRFYRDRLRQRRILAQQAKLAGMGSMLDNVAHQWRQPLQRIASNVAVLRTLLEDPEPDRPLLRGKLDRIQENLHYMTRTLESFRSYFRPGKRPEPFDPRESLRHALRLIDSRLEGVELTIEAPPGLPPVCAYEDEFQQVLLVLLHNALDQFQSRGTPRPRIRIELVPLHGELLLRLCDNGGGVAREHLDRIFEPYFSTKFPREGTGLGLYISKMLIENGMGGTLSVRNEEGGACFEIRLPSGEKPCST